MVDEDYPGIRYAQVCAGQDLAEVLPDGDGPTPDISAVVRESFNPIILAIRALEKPVCLTR